MLELFKKTFLNDFNWVYSSSSFDFTEEGNNYVMVKKLPENVNNDNINIEYDDETNLVTISISVNSDLMNYESTYSLSLPDDADYKTIYPTVNGSILTIIIDKK